MKKVKLLTFLMIITTVSCSKKIIKEPSKLSNNILTTYSGIKTRESNFFKNPRSIITCDNYILVVEDSSNLIRKISNEGVISTFAGTGVENDTYNNLENSSFESPLDIVKDSNGNFYVLQSHNRIAKIDVDGNVSNFNDEIQEYLSDEIEVGNPFLFIGLGGMAIDNKNNIYVAEGDLIKKISNNGKTIQIIAGSKKKGDRNGIGKNAKFDQISDIATGVNNEVYVVDELNEKIKVIKEDKIVTTFKSFKNHRFSPTSIDTDGEGNVYIYDGNQKRIQVYNSEGKFTRDINNKELASAKTQYSFLKIHVDDKKNIYIPTADFVYKIDTLNNFKKYGKNNGFSHDGKLSEATYYGPTDGEFDSKGNLYVLDASNYIIRKISPDGNVSTYAGIGEYGLKNGTINECRFVEPTAITIDSNDNLYILDDYEKSIRKIDNDGYISTWISSKDQQNLWERAYDIVCDSKDNIYLSDSSGNKIFKITPEKKVSVLKAFNLNTINNKLNLNSPRGLAIDGDDVLYICDKYNNKIKKVTNKGKVSILTVQNHEVIFDAPENIALDKFGNVYVTDSNRTKIHKISKKREVIVNPNQIGINKNPKISHYNSTLRISVNNRENSLYIFDRYDDLIRVVK